LKSAEGITRRTIQTRGRISLIERKKVVRGLNIEKLDCVPDAVLGQRVRQLDLPDLHLVHVEIYTMENVIGKVSRDECFIKLNQYFCTPLMIFKSIDN
jgi:hypothetical protein